MLGCISNSKDRIVPHQGAEQVNEYVAPGATLKKPQHLEKGRKSADSRSATITVLHRKEGTYFHPPMKDEDSTILEGSRSHASKNVVAASCDPQFIVSASGLASQDAQIPDEYFSDCNIDVESNILCSKTPIPGSRVSTDGSRSCYLSLDDVTPTVTNFDYLGNGNKDKENDLLYYDLPDIDNFDDIDQIFRNCDDTFGQGHTGTTDELSWFSSSSNTIYGSEVTFESGLQTSCSDFSPLNSTSGHHGASTNFLPKNDAPTVGHEKLSCLFYQSHADWPDTNAENKGESAKEDQVNDRGSGIKILALNQINGENSLNGCKEPDMISMHLKKLEAQYSSEDNKMQQLSDQKLLSSAVSVQACSSEHFPKQKHLFKSASSSYMHALDPHAQMEYGHPTHQIPLPQATSNIKFEYESNPSSLYKVPDNGMNHVPQCMEIPDQKFKLPTVIPEKLEKLHRRHQLCTSVVGEHLTQQASFTSNSSVQERHPGHCDEIVSNRKVENAGLEPAFEIDSSIIQESSCMTSVCPDDSSLEAISFRQLQDVMDQLDIRTKLCIRDSLYRLARSAKQRLGFTDTNNYNSVTKDARGIQCTETPEKCAEFVDAETVTNPLDRSIAHLLFTGLPEPVTRSL